jgi:hypothetical protein
MIRIRRVRKGKTTTHLDNTSLEVDGTVVLIANPDDTTAAEGTNTHTKDGTEDGVSGRDGHTELGGDGEVTGGGRDGADHTEHEKGGGVGEVVDRDDLGSDGISDTAANTNGTGEFENGAEDHGLDVGHGAGGDGRSPGVGGIVGTNVPRVEEREDGTDGKKVIELMESHGDVDRGGECSL